MLKLLSVFLAAALVAAPASAHPKGKHKKSRPAQARHSSPRPADNGAPVMVRYCPFSCRTEGIPKHRCRDWRRGDLCYVQDLDVPPDPRPRWVDPYDRYGGREHYRPYDFFRSASPAPSIGEEIGRAIDQRLEGLFR